MPEKFPCAKPGAGLYDYKALYIKAGCQGNNHQPDAGYDRPIAPSSPPFGIKPDENGQSVTFNKPALY